MPTNLNICDRCSRYQISKGSAIRFHRCKTDNGEYLFEWIASEILPDGELQYHPAFQVPIDCPFILEHTVSDGSENIQP